MRNNYLNILSIVFCPILLLLQFSAIGQKKFLNVKTPLFVSDTGRCNPLNHDNKIFIPSRTFTYSILHIDSAGRELNFCMKYNPLCKVNKSIPCLDWSIQIPENDTTLYPITIIKLYVLKGIALDESYSREQSIIRYDFFNGFGKIGVGEGTGVIEDSTQILLHPPRSHGFILNELNPFPQIKFPIKIGNTWKRYLSFGKGYTTSFKIPYFENVENVTIEHTYIIENEEDLETNFGLVHCSIVKGESGKYLWGSTQSKMYFSPKLGFMKIINNNYDKSTTTYTLAKIE